MAFGFPLGEGAVVGGGGGKEGRVGGDLMDEARHRGFFGYRAGGEVVASSGFLLG